MTENIGSYDYVTVQPDCRYSGSNHLHAVRKAASTIYYYNANGNMTSRNGSSIGYTSYNLPNVINAGSSSSTISYGAFGNRFKQVAVNAGSTETTIYVAGLLEKVTRGSLIEYRHTIHGGNGAAAIHTRRSGGTPASDTVYVHQDHLGSPELLTNASGAVVLRLSFGAYGERRDGSDWDGPVSAANLTTIGNTSRHGFTGHEHLDAVGLIHMNGRVYDPVAGRFLGVDPFIDGVASSQGPNGFAYVHNNPLSFTDPSGFVRDVTERPICIGADICGGGPRFPWPEPYEPPPWDGPLITTESQWDGVAFIGRLVVMYGVEIVAKSDQEAVIRLVMQLEQLRLLEELLLDSSRKQNIDRINIQTVEFIPNGALGATENPQKEWRGFELILGRTVELQKDVISPSFPNGDALHVLGHELFHVGQRAEYIETRGALARRALGEIHAYMWNILHADRIPGTSPELQIQFYLNLSKYSRIYLECTTGKPCTSAERAAADAKGE